MSFVVIDTSIVLPGLIGKPAEIDKPECVRARAFFEWLGKRPAAIAAPTLAELMLHRSGPLIGNVLQVIKSRLRVLPFDERSALQMGVLHSLRHLDGEIERIVADKALNRRALRFDLQVLAIAKAHGAECVYSMDDNMRSLAAGFILAHPIPVEVTAQQVLFDKPTP